jgi:hypothetical protein
MITVAVCLLAILFAAGSLTPLLLADDLDSVVDLHTPLEEPCSCCRSASAAASAAATRSA